MSTYVFFVSSSKTAVNSGSSISSAWKSSREREQECLNDLINSDVLSYRDECILCGSGFPSASYSSPVWPLEFEGDEVKFRLSKEFELELWRDLPLLSGVGIAGGEIGAGGVDMAGGAEVAMTRKVVHSNRTTSVALQASARIVRCFESTAALGISVRTM